MRLSCFSGVKIIPSPRGIPRISPASQQHLIDFKAATTSQRHRRRRTAIKMGRTAREMVLVIFPRACNRNCRRFSADTRRCIACARISLSHFLFLCVPFSSFPKLSQAFPSAPFFLFTLLIALSRRRRFRSNPGFTFSFQFRNAIPSM